MVLFTLADKRRMSNRKADILHDNPNMDNVQAEMQAIRNIEALKIAGLLTPTPTPKPAGRPRATKVAPRNLTEAPQVFQSPGGRIRFGRKLCTSFKKDELITILKKLGRRVDSSMTVKQLCALAAPNRVSPPKPVRSPPKPARSPPKPVKKRTIVVINTEPDCMKTRKSDLIEMARQKGIPGALSKMTIKDLCCALKRAEGITETPKSRIQNAILNVRKQTYLNYKKPNITKLVKHVGIKGYSKNRKDQLIKKLHEKLEKNMFNYLNKSRANLKTVTARQIAEALAKNYGWMNNRHVERNKIRMLHTVAML